MEDNTNNELEDSIAGNMLYNFVKDTIMKNEMAKNIVETMQRYGLNEKQSILLYHEMVNIIEKY